MSTTTPTVTANNMTASVKKKVDIIEKCFGSAETLSPTPSKPSSDIYVVMCWPGSMTPEPMAYFHTQKEADAFCAEAKAGKVPGWEWLFPGPTDGSEVAYVIDVPFGGSKDVEKSASKNNVDAK